MYCNSDLNRKFKVEIDCFNKAVRSKYKLMQWINTDQVLSWLPGLKNKRAVFLSLV